MFCVFPLLLSLTPGVDADPARLREWLHDRQDARQQAQAAVLLVQLRTPDADAVVRQGLRQTDAPEVFQALTTALRVCQDSRFNDELLHSLTDPRPPIRLATAQTLALVGGAQLVPALRRCLTNASEEVSVRQTAIWILGRSGRKQAVPLLLEQLDSGEESLKRAAAEALGELTGLTYGLQRDAWKQWWSEVRTLPEERWLEQRLAYQASRSQRLDGELERSRAQIVRLQQQLYQRLPAADRLAHVQGIVEHEDPAVRQLAVQWTADLLTSADEVTRPTLDDMLMRLSRDGQTDVQRLAVLGLGRVQDPLVLARLRILLKSGSPSVRAAAARSLAQQARGAEAQTRRKEIVPLLQNALSDSAVEVVIEVAEDLGMLGVPEAAPVLVCLLKHESESVRQAAAQALERVADASVVAGLLIAFEEASSALRFTLVGAVSHAAGDRGHCLSDEQRGEVRRKLATLVEKDSDPGVRSRAATALGECGGEEDLKVLWQRVETVEDRRVQEKAFLAFMDILDRSESLKQVQTWEASLAERRQSARQLQLLSELTARWSRRPATRAHVPMLRERLIPVQLEQGRWSAAAPLLREMLIQSGNDAEAQNRHLGWLATVCELALKEGQPAEAQRWLREAQNYLPTQGAMAERYTQLERRTRELLP